MRRYKYPCEKRGDFLELTAEGHDIWMKENNPDGWDDETWRAFVLRCRNPDFVDRCQDAKRRGLSRPHPTADGWKPPKGNPILALVKQVNA